MKKQTALHLENGVEVPRIGVMAAFGCNYQGDIAPAQVISILEDGLAIAEEAGADIKCFSLADTMGWATPMRIERVLGEVRSPFEAKLGPLSIPISLGDRFISPAIARWMLVHAPELTGECYDPISVISTIRKQTLLPDFKPANNAFAGTQEKGHWCP